jgi:thiol-disulfide isomerase/thioredoxin
VQAVVASSAAAPAGSTHGAESPPKVSAPPAARRDLCAGQLSGAGEAFKPTRPPAQASASGQARLPAQPIANNKTWTWVNFWAAWCVPCKEEIPRLVDWRKKLNEAGTPFALSFVSLDDDQRQLEQFLANQPEDGLRATHWLKDPDEREKWLEEIGVGADPELPAHLILDPKGKLRCVVRGAVEDGDYDQVRQLLE